jgi:hypothetical protein
MAQVIAPPIAGLTLCAGPNGPVKILSGYGSPNSQPSADVQLASQGSLYLQIDGASTTTTLWVCTTSGVPATTTAAQTTSVWTSK